MNNSLFEASSLTQGGTQILMIVMIKWIRIRSNSENG